MRLRFWTFLLDLSIQLNHASERFFVWCWQRHAAVDGAVHYEDMRQ